MNPTQSNLDAPTVAAVWTELEPLVAASAATQAALGRFRIQHRDRSIEAPLPPSALHEMRKETRRYLDVEDHLEALVGRALVSERNATDPSAATLATATALAASVLLYDNYLAMLPLVENRRFRRIVNHVDLGYGIRKNELWHVVERLNDMRSRRALARLIGRWEDRRDTMAVGEAPAGRLNEIISASATYYLARDGKLETRLPAAALIQRERILDGLAQIGNDTLYLVSEGFGNAIGQIELRKGKLWQREDVLGHLHCVLQPLDILLEKTPFRLTDLLIPGHFGHVAIWMGRPRKLKRLGVWQHPEMQQEKFQACRSLIEDGHGVLEALRSGVELNPLRVFANVDDLVVLRPARFKRKQILESLVRGFHQVGKKYDFNFDVETTDTIVCSELPYHVFSSVAWRTEEQMGRFTISPDDVAKQALGQRPDFGLMAFYHDGALVPPDQAKAKIEQLLG